jgi:HSP20 family protein
MTLAYRDPYEQLQNELDRMLGAALGSVGSAGLYPPVNVFDAADAFVVKAELPGVTPEQVQIEVENETLTVRGERAFSEPSGDAAYHRRELGVGQFRRVVRMPGRLDPEGAKAEYRDGVLTVRVAKARETRPRRVEIQAS